MLLVIMLYFLGNALLDDVELKLGMMCTIGPRRFVPFLQAFRERHPKVRLVVQDGSHLQLQERLAQGELDVAADPRAARPPDRRRDPHPAALDEL